MSDTELGAFLRACREAVTPAEVGLPDSTRRRTPGLRRAELATLAGISVDYLTRIEQGRDRHPSAQVLAALADALRLSEGQRLHLLTLAKATDGAGQLLCPVAQQPADPAGTVRPTVRALLERLEPAPALVTNRHTDVLAHTEGFVRLAAPLGLLEGQPPNLARFVFTDPRAKAAYPHWDQVADQQAALLKVASVRACPDTTALIEELAGAAGAAFSKRLTAMPRLPSHTGVERLAHPDAGELRLAYELLELPDSNELRLLVYLPADPATAARLDQLTRRHPGALRAV